MQLQRIAFGTVAAFLLAPAGLYAQAEEMAADQRPMYELPTLSVVVSGETPLDIRAADLFQAGDWNAAADLYVDAADGMPPRDANSYELLDMAGRLYFYGRDYSSSRKAMERAAAVAEATGDVVSAAFRHVDAAFIAVWEGYPGSRREHVRQALAHAETDGFGSDNARRVQALIHGVESLPAADAADGADGR